jgi:hypothetical protein
MIDMPEVPDSEGRYFQLQGEILEHTIGELTLVARLEDYFNPRPAKLVASKDDANRLDQLIAEVGRAYGGAPRLIVQGIADPKPMFDTYMTAALGEAKAVFERTRRSLCRAHASMIGANCVRQMETFNETPQDERYWASMQHFSGEVFWEHAETTFIRLASYWDRIGQILDFAFFSIRQYERDGFSAVMDRIQSNVLRMNPDYRVHESWIALRTFRKSQQEDGLQWLLSRRNLLVHSMHLRGQVPAEENELFDSAFNHLDARFRDSLAPSDPAKEINRLHVQLNQAAQLFPHVLRFCEHHANRETAFD